MTMESKAHEETAGNLRPVQSHWHQARITQWQETELSDGRRRWTLIEPPNRFAVQEFRVSSGGGGQQVLLILCATDGPGDDPLGTFPLLRDAFDAVGEELGAQERAARLQARERVAKEGT